VSNTIGPGVAGRGLAGRGMVWRGRAGWGGARHGEAWVCKDKTGEWKWRRHICGSIESKLLERNRF
jgi:hypothetical protein